MGKEMLLKDNINIVLEEVDGVEVIILWLGNRKDLNYIGIPIAEEYNPFKIKRLLDTRYSDIIIKDKLSNKLECVNMVCAGVVRDVCLLSSAIYKEEQNVRELRDILNTIPLNKYYFILKAEKSIKE